MFETLGNLKYLDNLNEKGDENIFADKKNMLNLLYRNDIPNKGRPVTITDTE